MAEPTLDQLDQEDKKIHGAISRIASHTKGNLGRILGVEKRLEGNSNKITLLKNIIKAQQINIGEKLKSLSPVGTPLDESIQSITDSVKSIHQTLLDQQDVADDQADDAAIDAEQDKRDSKEAGREKTGGIGEGIKKTGGKLLKPVKGAFDRIKEWLIKLFAAKAIMMFMQWFSDPANQKKVSSIFRFIKDWWPAIVTGLLLFCSSMLGPGGIILAVGALVIGFIPKIINAVKSILTFGLAGGKEAEKGEKLANKALKEGEKQDKADPESLKPEDDPADAPEPGTQETPGLEMFNKGGQVPGSGDKDTVPAMLTPGEFVMSKGAVEQYGIDTMEGMNAAAGGTNAPTIQKGGGKGMNMMIPRYKGGGKAAGVVTDPKERQQQEAYMLKYVNEERALQGLEPLTNLTYAPGVELTKAVGPGPRTKETSNTNFDFNTGLKTTSKSKTVDGKTTFSGGMSLITEEEKQKFFAANPHAKALLDIKNQAELDNLGADISASAKMNGGGLVQGFAGGGLINKLPQVRAAKWLGNKAKGAFNFAKDKISDMQKPRVDHIHPPADPVSNAAAAQVAQSSGDAATASTEPAPGIPNFDAGMMRSQSKIRTLGVSV